MFRCFRELAEWLIPSENSELKQERKFRKETLKMIKRYNIWFMIIDRQSGQALLNHSLSEYNDKYHDILVDGYEFMKYAMRS